jgi:signal transduction histidine kinase
MRRRPRADFRRDAGMTAPQRTSRPPASLRDDPEVVAELLLRADAGAERERHQLEQNLRIHRDIFRHMQFGLLVWRCDDGTGRGFRLVTANPAASAIAGIDFDRLVGAGLPQVLPAAAVAGVTARLAARLDGETADDEGDLTWPRHDGPRIFSLKSFALPERLAALTFDDVTERRAMADRLRQAEKMDTVGRLAGGLAHDFNNLLATITTAASLLDDSLVAEDPRRRDVRLLLDAAGRGAAMARRLLTFSRRQPTEPRALDLTVSLDSLRPLLGRLVGAAVEVSYALTRDLPEVLADPLEIEQVLLNLAVNAQQAMPAGGRLHLGTRIVHLGGRPWVELSVADTGIGMDEETRTHIFEPYYTTKGEGTGLGLATVYGIVNSRGGEIDVESAPGAGTTFRVRLRALDAA